VSAKHQAAIRRALAAQEHADAEVRAAVRAANNDPDEPASIRELAAFLKRSPNTVRAILKDD
jgi:methylphosphotriester-DNA--protein-cysteine methyltransferase